MTSQTLICLWRMPASNAKTTKPMLPWKPFFFPFVHGNPNNLAACQTVAMAQLSVRTCRGFVLWPFWIAFPFKVWGGKKRCINVGCEMFRSAGGGNPSEIPQFKNYNQSINIFPSKCNCAWKNVIQIKWSLFVARVWNLFHLKRTRKNIFLFVVDLDNKTELLPHWHN